jgi:stage IV sporulation protein A
MTARPFAVMLNTTHPDSEQTAALCAELSEQYGVPVCPVNCLEIGEEEIRRLLAQILFEFPVREIGFEIPSWVMDLNRDHPLRLALMEQVRVAAEPIRKVRELQSLGDQLTTCEYVSAAALETVRLGDGSGVVSVTLKSELFYQIRGEMTGLPIPDDGALMACMTELAAIRRRYDKIKNALDQAEAGGYGIVMPTTEEMTLEEPEIIRQSGRYGVRLRATAPSIHIMKANITTEVSPIVGSERQSEELVNYLLREFEEDPSKIWESNIFGTSLYGLVNEGLHNKLYRMPSDARLKLKETVERLINDGCNGLICIIV